MDLETKNKLIETKLEQLKNGVFDYVPEGARGKPTEEDIKQYYEDLYNKKVPWYKQPGGGWDPYWS